MRQIPNFIGFWLLHFHWIDIKFLKICSESLFIKLFQLERITETLMKNFQVAESCKLIVFNSQWFFPRKSNLVPLIIVADCLVQFVKGFLAIEISRFAPG